MSLIDKAHNEFGENTILNFERIFENLGITGVAAMEFSPWNIKAFNEVCENHTDVNYYSIGAKKNGRSMNKMLLDGYNIIVNDTMGVQCDGMV